MQTIKCRNLISNKEGAIVISEKAADPCNAKEAYCRYHKSFKTAKKKDNSGIIEVVHYGGPPLDSFESIPV